jgi:hypothetical protein
MKVAGKLWKHRRVNEGRIGSDEPVSLPARPIHVEVSMARAYRCDGCVVVLGSCASGSCGVHVAVAGRP